MTDTWEWPNEPHRSSARTSSSRTSRCCKQLHPNRRSPEKAFQIQEQEDQKELWPKNQGKTIANYCFFTVYTHCKTMDLFWFLFLKTVLCSPKRRKTEKTHIGLVFSVLKNKENEENRKNTFGFRSFTVLKNTKNTKSREQRTFFKEHQSGVLKTCSSKIVFKNRLFVSSFFFFAL